MIYILHCRNNQDGHKDGQSYKAIISKQIPEKGGEIGRAGERGGGIRREGWREGMREGEREREGEKGERGRERERERAGWSQKIKKSFFRSVERQ